MTFQNTPSSMQPTSPFTPPNNLINALVMRSGSSNFQNRASYKGECKRLMSRAHIETVAERAAHFEEVDPERYNRLKNKFYELDQNQQQELLQMHNNMQYPAGTAPNSNLILLNHFVESLMMSPNYLINNNNNTNNSNAAQNKLSSKSFQASSKLDSNTNSNQMYSKTNQNSNYTNVNTMNDYLSKVIENKKQPATYDELLGKYEQNINKFYTGEHMELLCIYIF